MTGLYIHIPFCLKKCHYCNYVITTGNSDEYRSRFFEALGKEIQHAEAVYGNLIFDTLYIGGGTPSALSAEEMGKLFRMIRKAFRFKKGIEITCEVNPGDVSDEKLDRYLDLGINRISLGVQSFENRLLKDMGRIHSARDAVNTYHAVRQRGFRNVSVDLILRLPGQTQKEFQGTLEKSISLGPDQVVLYDLNVHQKTVYGSRLEKGRLDLPNESEHAILWEMAERLLKDAGYIQYEISSFAKPGFQSRHNLVYWHNQEYLGLGPGAYSYMKGKRVVFADSVHRYLEKLSVNDWTNDQEETPDPNEKDIESCLTGLRLKEGIQLNDFPTIKEHLSQEIKRLKESGLVENDHDRWRLTRRGRLLAETVFTELTNS